MGDVYMSGIACRGSFALGNACRKCSRCLAEIKRWEAAQSVHSALNTPSSALKEIRDLKAKVVELEKELSAPNSNISALCKQLAKVTKERTDAKAKLEEAFQAGRESTVKDVIWIHSEYDVISPGILRSELDKVYEDLIANRVPLTENKENK
jgi:predicted  nucleic acid-binding Zn-ribbon protein